MLAAARSLAALAAGAAALVGVIALLHVRRARKPHVRPGISESSLRLLRAGRRRIVSRLANTGAFFGVDIGGTLVKLAFFEPDAAVVDRVMSSPPPGRAAEWADRVGGVRSLAAFLLSRSTYGATGVRDDSLAFHLPELGGTFHFIRFETRRLTGALRLVAAQGLHSGMVTLCATGGGALRYRSLVASLLGGVELLPVDEIDCLVKGMGFLMSHVPSEAYTFHGRRLVDVGPPNGGGGSSGGGSASGGGGGSGSGGGSDSPSSLDGQAPSGPGYPYLLVNVGSGVGFILVTSETEWRRVSGTSIGGGTYYGLTCMLTGVSSFDEMLDLAEDGNNANVDLTVGDIYGGDYSAFGLKASTIASSFGKAVTWNSGSSGGGGGGGGERGGRAGSSATADGGGAHPPPCRVSPRAASLGAPGPASAPAASAGGGGSTLSRVLEEAGAYTSDIIGGKGPTRSESVRLQHEPAPSSPPPVRRGSSGGGGSVTGDDDVRATPLRLRVPVRGASVRRGGGGGGGASSAASSSASSPSASLATGPLWVRAASAAGGVDAVVGGSGSSGGGAPPDTPLLDGDDEFSLADDGGIGFSGGGSGVAARLSWTGAARLQAAGGDRRAAAATAAASAGGGGGGGAAGSDAAPAPPSPPIGGVAQPLDAASVIGLSAAGSGAWGERRYGARDVARSMLIMISNNIGQLAYLNALKHKCKCVGGLRRGVGEGRGGAEAAGVARACEWPPRSHLSTLAAPTFPVTFPLSPAGACTLRATSCATRTRSPCARCRTPSRSGRRVRGGGGGGGGSAGWATPASCCGGGGGSTRRAGVAHSLAHPRRPPSHPRPPCRHHGGPVPAARGLLRRTGRVPHDAREGLSARDHGRPAQQAESSGGCIACLTPTTKYAQSTRGACGGGGGGRHGRCTQGWTRRACDAARAPPPRTPLLCPLCSAHAPPRGRRGGRRKTAGPEGGQGCANGRRWQQRAAAAMAPPRPARAGGCGCGAAAVP
jgi:type II pantothenate kinase